MLAILAVVSLAPLSDVGAGGDRSPEAGLLDAAGELLAPVVPDAVPLPSEPAAALQRAVTGVASRLEMPVDAGAVLARAGLDPRLGGRLALLLEDLAACQDATARLLAALPAPLATYLDDAVTAPPVPGAAAVRSCAARLQAHGLELSRFLAGMPADMGSDVALWPVLRLDLDGSDDVVIHDYALSVDAGGNDTYLNNAGGNPLDLMRGPNGSVAPKKEPARGCINPGFDLFAGECVLAAALLVDVAGDDTYGHMQPPDVEALCTDEPSVRRVMTTGAGFAGAGIFIEVDGDDRYLGKSVAQGAGHIGGVGVLWDEAGDDIYTAMRLSKGFGTVQGLGLLRDGGGNDRYDYYMPRPIDPGAPTKTPGSGGGFSAQGLCDNTPRWDEGTGLLGGIGLLVEASGDDTYVAGPTLEHRLGTTEPLRQTGSLGFGDVAGFGYMHDLGGRDTYQGISDRADDTTVMPTPEASGVFIDGSGKAARMRAAGGGATLMAAYSGHYLPGTITVDGGTALQFLNPDLFYRLEALGHTVTEIRADGGPPRFDSGLVEFGQAKEVVGAASLGTGRYDFYCEIHPFMRGVLTVR
ncbi:MAG: cupredoxin domain-containing protein [Acidimicrobiia bacterium]